MFPSPWTRAPAVAESMVYNNLLTWQTPVQWDITGLKWTERLVVSSAVALSQEWFKNLENILNKTIFSYISAFTVSKLEGSSFSSPPSAHLPKTALSICQTAASLTPYTWPYTHKSVHACTHILTDTAHAYGAPKDIENTTHSQPLIGSRLRNNTPSYRTGLWK